jgi:hypothetical protein
MHSQGSGPLPYSLSAGVPLTMAPTVVAADAARPADTGALLSSSSSALLHERVHSHYHASSMAGGGSLNGVAGDGMPRAAAIVGSSSGGSLAAKGRATGMGVHVQAAKEAAVAATAALHAAEQILEQRLIIVNRVKELSALQQPRCVRSTNSACIWACRDAHAPPNHTAL